MKTLFQKMRDNRAKAQGVRQDKEFRELRRQAMLQDEARRSSLDCLLQNYGGGQVMQQGFGHPRKVIW